MALTRKMLKAMGIEEEKIDQIIEAHTESTDALKAERDTFKADAEKLPELQKQYDDLRDEVENSDAESYKEKYEKEHQDFEDYKSGVEADKLAAKKVAAYKELLKKAGISEKRLDAIVKVTSLDDVELDDAGAIIDADSRIDGIKEEWSDFVTTTRTDSETPETPPSGSGADGDKPKSRAAEIAQRHNERLYGVKGEDK